MIVPGDLKADMREFLEQCHGMSEKRIYDDIHGYIQNQDVTTPHVVEARRRRARYRSEIPDLNPQLAARMNTVRRGTYALHYFHQRGMEYAEHAGSIFVLEAKDDEGVLQEPIVLALRPNEIVDLMSACIEDGGRCLTLEEAYCWRGGAHVFSGSVELADADFAKSIELSQSLPEAYQGRANVRMLRSEQNAAIADLKEALRLSPKLVPALIAPLANLPPVAAETDPPSTAAASTR